MRERDGRTHREICELFQWANADSFWCKNILSPAKLREQWDRLVIERNQASKKKSNENHRAWSPFDDDDEDDLVGEMLTVRADVAQKLGVDYEILE